MSQEEVILGVEDEHGPNSDFLSLEEMVYHRNDC